MYVYYFGSDKGKSYDIYAFKVRKFYEVKRVFKSEKQLYSTTFKREDCLNRDASNLKNDAVGGCRVSVKEGDVYKRRFWLEEYDMEKAAEIVKNYRIEKAEFYKKKYERFLEEES